LHARAQRRTHQLEEVQCVRATSYDLVIIPQRDDASQHQQATDGGIQHKLERRVDAILAAPRAEQQVGRDQHHFPENVEQEEVGREKHAQDAAL